MQVNGMRLMGLTVSSGLKNFDICNEKFLSHLEKVAVYLPSQSEISVLEVDPVEREIKQLVTVDLQVPKFPLRQSNVHRTALPKPLTTSWTPTWTLESS